MKLPFFFETKLSDSSDVELNDETSRHISQVLRMKPGAPILLTNGKGLLAEASVTLLDRKKCSAHIISSKLIPLPAQRNSIAISLIKNTSRFEWFVEKATELGISEIIPLICDRTEKQKSRPERLQSIMISSMLQSQQVWLPVLHPAEGFKAVVENNNSQQKFIAHCKETGTIKLVRGVDNLSSIILIGPEGDFTSQEIEHAIQHKFIPVSLGANRLRTETAGMVAAVFLQVP